MKLTILACLTIVVPAACLAQDIKPMDVKLGLWETSSKTDMPGMPASLPQIPEDALAKMPPEQRARIEAMMKGRGAPGTMTTKSCLTREVLERSLGFQNDKSCTYKVTSSSPSKQQAHVECDRGQVHTTGDLTLERVDAEHVKGSMVMKPSVGTGDIKVSFDTRWISSDCGSVKPITAK